MATLTNSYLDSTVLKALLIRIANMYNSIKTDIDTIDLSALVASATYAGGTLTFYNTDGISIGTVDLSALVVDGMIDTVSYNSSTATLNFVFNTDAGKEDIAVDLASLIDTYTAGDGIDITDNVVSVVKSSTSEDYLTVDSTGVAITGIDEIKTQVETNTSSIEALETWVDTDGAITEEELDELILEVEEETAYGMASAMGISAE